MNKNLITLNPIKSTKELSNNIWYQCNYCGDTVEPTIFSHLNEILSGDGLYHCNFCLRNNLSNKNKNIFVLSFRGIIGYYYTKYYLPKAQSKHKMYFSEIQNYINSHEETGLLNPLFIYNRHNMLWFIDFSRIGKEKNKIQLEDILKNIINILTCFNLHQIQGFQQDKLYLKYEEAISKFYKERYRPEDKKFCIPSLIGCGSYEESSNKSEMEAAKNFNIRNLII